MSNMQAPRIKRETKVLLVTTTAVFMALLDVTVVNVVSAASALCALAGGLVAATLRNRRSPADRQPIDVPGMETRTAVIHGRRFVYRTAGSGPPVVLVHGLLDCSRTWRLVAPALARRFTVIAPDLPGHGDSDGSPGSDYSLGAHAAMVRDLLDILGHHRVTLVGHSLGGAVALMFAYCFQERVDRLALVSSGGFGRAVHPFVRLVALPGFGLLARLACSRASVGLVATAARLLRVARATAAARRVDDVYAALARLAAGDGRRAFIGSVREVIDLRGQKVSALERLPILRVPMLVMWGTCDRVLPVAHVAAVRAQCPNATMLLLDGVGHSPQLSSAAVVAQRLTEFISPSRLGMIEEVSWQDASEDRQLRVSRVTESDGRPGGAPGGGVGGCERVAVSPGE